MALTDTTNVAAVASPAGAETAALKAKPTGSTAPNPEKLGIALDAVAGFDAAARDDATAKLEAAASKDAAGLCIALLGVASDAGCASARRLAAATFTRNCLRKQWGARDETTTHEPARVTPEARADVRGASLRALVAAPPDTRRLLADCLRLAATDAVGWSASGTTDARDGATVAFAAPGTDGRDRLASAAALVEDVIAVSAARAFCSFEENTTSASHGLLLAAHVASMPFQYFRDPTVAFEAAHPAAERLSASLVAPRLVPALTRAAAADFTNDRDAAQFARVAFKIIHRLVRAHMPAAIAPALPAVVGAIEAACAARAAEARRETELSSAFAADVSWVAAKRALRLGAALVTRHADALDAASIASLARSGLAIAALRPGLAPTPSAAAAFALLRATLERAATRDALLFATRENERLEERTNNSNSGLPSTTSTTSTTKARRVALARLVRACVVPHVCLTEEDESSLASDPEEYARANACGEAAEDDAVQDALDGNVSGVTSRRAALDFLEALARVSFDANDGEAAGGPPSAKPPRAEPTRPPPAKKAKKDEKDDAAEDEDEPSSGSAKPTLGELAARDVVDEMLAAAPKEKVEKVGKSAGAAGAAVEHAAPAAEAALGVSAYFGVLRVAGALTAASRRAKESATRTFCRKHAFPAVAAAASPHVVVAAAAHCADVAAKITTAAVAREAFAALVAALERATPECASSDISMDEEETEEAWRVARDAASWAARAVVSETPCAEEAFGQSQAYFESLAERLVARAEASPARGAAPLRALAALAEAASGAVAPGAAAALAARVAAAYAATLRLDAAEPDEDAENADDETELGAWDTSVEAVAALCEAAETWEAPEEDEREKTLRRNALAGLAVTAAAHVRAYWDAAAALEPPCAAMDDAAEEAEEQEAPPAHPAAAPTLRFACETLAETVEEGGSADAATASAVWSAAGAWASHLPAWRARDGDDALDDDALDALTAIVGAAVEAKAGETALAAIAVPAARAAAAALGETEDADARLAAGRAVAAAVAAYPPAATAEVVAAARDAVDAAMGRRAARNALHVLASVAAAAPAEVARDPAGWMRARDDAASAAGWSPVGADGALLAAHVDACVSMLRGATRPGAGAPDKRLLGATLTEAMRCANELAAEGEEGEEEEDDSDSDSDDDADDDSDDDADRLENESEADFLERYAAIARELAEKPDGGEEEDDEDAFDRDDDAFDRALTPTRGDGVESARTFRAWFAEWRAGGSSGARVAALVDAAVAKRFEKTS